MASIGSLDELLRPTLSEVVEQWESIHHREPYEQGRRQADFTAAEIIMSHGASLIVDHRRYGSTTAHSAEEPVLLLASLFRRPPTSVLAKMANLDGSRPHGARFDHAAGLAWSADPDRFDRAYATVLLAARRAGIGATELPDFLDPGWKA